MVLEYDRLPASSAVYPLSLQTFVNGAPAGTVAVEQPSTDLAASFEFAVPDVHPGAEYPDIRIQTSNWVAAKTQGLSRLISFRLQRIGLRD